MKKGTYDCNGTVEFWQESESLVIHENQPINIKSELGPFVQVAPQNATINVIPNEILPINIEVSVNLLTLKSCHFFKQLIM